MDSFGTPGDAYHQWDAVSRRRYAASLRAPKSSWDVPADWNANAQPAGSGAAAGGYTPNGGAPASTLAEPGFLAFRNNALADASAHAAGARLTAMDAAPNDPSVAAYGSLAGELGGQSQASHDVNAYAAHTLDVASMRAYEEHLMRLKQQLEEEQMRNAGAGQFWGDLANIGGRLGSAFIGG